MAGLAPPEPFGGRRLMWASAAAGGIGLAMTVVGFAVAPARTLYAYLTAFSFAVSLSVGALLLLLIGSLATSGWILVLRRLANAVAAALPVLALLFIPIAVGASELYPWVSPSPELGHHERELIAHKASYLNLPAFVIRTIVYFGVWIAAWLLLLRWSVPRSGPRSPGPGRARALAAAATPLVGLTLTFASFDWLMSLQPTWYSSIFGVYVFAGGFLGALAALAVVAALADRRGHAGGALTGYHFHALGRLVFAFVAFWAYAGFFQLFLIYIADKPVEVPFYIERLEDGWQWVALVLIVGNFALPFFALLSRAIKFRKTAMLAIGAWLVAMHYLDVYWLVIPAAGGASAHWTDAAALAGVVGLCTAFGAWTLRGRYLVPLDDPDFARAAAYRSA